MSLELTGRFIRGAADVTTDIAVADGQIIAVTGANGTGKSTLVRVIAGLHPLTDGQLSVDGVVWDSPSTKTWVSPETRSLGVVMQSPALFPHMSALRNVMFGLITHGVERAVARSRARGLLDDVGAGHLCERRPRDLSGGEVQRVALARALAPQPRVLLLDEPLSAVDEASRAGLLDTIIRALADFGGMALLVMHDRGLAERSADTIVHL